MHALTILHRCLGPLLSGIHARRLATLLEAVAATVCGRRLTLTDIGRRFGGGASLRNKIKRADRLLGNRHLQGQARTIYAALARK
ncbi:MAG: IS4 family transposase, partial [Chromatiaceae bacterium]